MLTLDQIQRSEVNTWESFHPFYFRNNRLKLELTLLWFSIFVKHDAEITEPVCTYQG